VIFILTGQAAGRNAGLRCRCRLCWRRRLRVRGPLLRRNGGGPFRSRQRRTSASMRHSAKLVALWIIGGTCLELRGQRARGRRVSVRLVPPYYAVSFVRDFGIGPAGAVTSTPLAI